MDVHGVREALRRAALDRTAAALVATPDTVAEVSVAPGGRWVVRSHSIEWIGSPERIDCWEVLSAGARPITHNRPSEWVHPAVGMLWPERLPIWGRVGDSHVPSRLIPGLNGPGQVVLDAVDRAGLPLPGGEEREAGAAGTSERAATRPPASLSGGCYLQIDAKRWLCLQLELFGRIWTLQEYQE